MTLKPLGDSAWLIEFPGITGKAALARVMGLVAALTNDRPAGVLDVVPSFASAAVHFEGGHGAEIREWIDSVRVVDQWPEGEEREIPVCYGGEYGPDLVELATETGLSTDQIIALHSSATYTVAAVGFSPGFPYLLGLPERLQVPRRKTPRLAVPAGSVAIAGEQAGIYPFTSPGGWHLLGRTGVSLFEPSLPRPALLQPGDRVRFIPVEKCGSPPEISPAFHPPSDRWLEVIHPGSLTTVQDLGRPGHQSSGVSPGGAIDRQTLRIANLLVGNDEDAAALEICMSGPVLKFQAKSTVAMVSSTGKPRQVKAGETVDFSKLTDGMRAYLAVAGGLRVPIVLGSASTDLRSGFGGCGGRALQAGDRLELGPPNRAPLAGDWHVRSLNHRRGNNDRIKQSWHEVRQEMLRTGCPGHGGTVKEIELRFIPGVQEHWFTDEALRRFRTETYQLTPLSDRMGTRLSGGKLELAAPREMVSQPVACGSVQVPPDGQPIILLAERQTIGGYPQIGHIISADLPKLARAWPGTMLKFREITLAEAWNLRREAKREFAWLRTGLDLLK